MRPDESLSSWMTDVQAAVVACRDGRDSAALQTLLEEKLLEAEKLGLPEDFRASLHNELGLARAMGGDLPGADEQFGLALRYNPTSINALYNRANAALSAGQPEDAADWFGRVLEVEPEHTGALYRMGLAFSRQGKPGEALPWFEAAARRDADFPAAQYWAAECLLHKGEYARALPYFEHAARLMPGNDDALRGQAICLLETGAPGEALAACENLLQVAGPRQFMTLRIKGEALLALGDASGAARCHADMARLDVDAREYIVGRARRIAEDNPTLGALYMEVMTEELPELESVLKQCRAPRRPEEGVLSSGAQNKGGD